LPRRYAERILGTDDQRADGVRSPALRACRERQRVVRTGGHIDAHRAWRFELQVSAPHGRNLNLYCAWSIVAQAHGHDGLLALEQPCSAELDLGRQVRFLGENQPGAGEEEERQAEQRELRPAAGQRRDQAGSGQGE
jgi:hypothetical protein